MNAVLAVVNEDVRLYSRQPRLPVDVIAPQHVEVHGHLERWGAWTRGSRGGPDTAGSAEGWYDPSSGREVRRPVIALPPNPMNICVYRAVQAMPMQHGDTVKAFYVRRFEPAHICRKVAVIRFEDFARWMFDCRAMVINLLRHG